MAGDDCMEAMSHVYAKSPLPRASTARVRCSLAKTSGVWAGSLPVKVFFLAGTA